MPATDSASRSPNERNSSRRRQRQSTWQLCPKTGLKLLVGHSLLHQCSGFLAWPTSISVHALRGEVGAGHHALRKVRHQLCCSASPRPAASEPPVDRPPRGKKRDALSRDGEGLPVERVYAPRRSQYPEIKPIGRSRGARAIRPQGEERDVGINNPAKLRVAGGSARGRRLESPDVFLRPMMGKVKEALFSYLTGFGVFDEGFEGRFLDLFAGSGSVGIESLSRGAAHATFVDFAKNCCEVATRNANRCGFEGRTKAVCGDVLDVLKNPLRHGLAQGYDVVTVTPPYQEIVYADLIRAVAESDLVREDTIVVIEYPVELGCLPSVIGGGKMVGLRNRRYGRTVLGLYIYNPSGKLDLADSRPEEFIKI